MVGGAVRLVGRRRRVGRGVAKWRLEAIRREHEDCARRVKGDERKSSMRGAPHSLASSLLCRTHSQDRRRCARHAAR
eukprot:4855706-Prymnesium_polylepis.1